MKPINQILSENNETLYYKKDLNMIKNAWMNKIKQIDPKTCLDYYYMGMAKNAIVMLNSVSRDLFLNHHCHKGKEFDEDIADNRARDLCELYRYQYLTFEEVIFYLEEYSIHEKYYFLVRLIYPSFYFDYPQDIDFLERMIGIYRKQIEEVTKYLSKHLSIPTLLW